MPRGARTLRGRVAASLDAPEACLRLVPELLAGLDALGGSPSRAASWLAAGGIGPRARVIDLGCGTGAVAVAIARRTGCRVVGVDGLRAFVDAARARASAAGVAGRCAFRHGDLERVRPPRAGGFDAAVMTAVRPVLEAAALLARLVRPGGLVLIEDAVGAPGVRGGPGGPPTAQEVRSALRRLGLRVLRERVDTARRTGDAEAAVQRTIARNAAALVRRRPDRGVLVGAFRRVQRAGAAPLTTARIRGASWLLRTPPAEVGRSASLPRRP